MYTLPTVHVWIIAHSYSPIHHQFFIVFGFFPLASFLRIPIPPLALHVSADSPLWFLHHAYVANAKERRGEGETKVLPNENNNDDVESRAHTQYAQTGGAATTKDSFLPLVIFPPPTARTESAYSECIREEEEVRRPTQWKRKTKAKGSLLLWSACLRARSNEARKERNFQLATCTGREPPQPTTLSPLISMIHPSTPCECVHVVRCTFLAKTKRLQLRQ